MITSSRAGFAAVAGVLLLAVSAGEGTAVAQQARESTAADGDAEWQVLFDGTSLDAWERVGDANWRIEGDAVRADGGGQGHLVSTASYADFELHVEFWVSDDANSGVFVRCADGVEINAQTCYEVNIFDQRPDPTYRTGSIVDLAPPAAQIDAGGRWSTFRITARGPRLTVVMNDTTTVDVEDDTHREGPITLQYGSGTVMFRNVRLRQL